MLQQAGQPGGPGGQERQIPTLLDACLSSAASSATWTKQRRSLQRLPEEAANQLLRMVLSSGLLDRPHLLSLFQHTATRLHITPHLAPHAAAAVDNTWMAYVRELAHLTSLSLQACPRLRDAHLGAGPGAWGSASTLTDLSLAGCTGLTGACLADSLAHLSALRSLDLSRCTGLAAPLRLQLSCRHLTRLCVADVAAFDDEAAGLLLDVMPELRDLGAAGTGLGLAGVQMLGFCGALVRLDVSWTAVDMLPALPLLEELIAQHNHLSGVWWPSVEPPPAPVPAPASPAPSNSSTTTAATPPLRLRRLNLANCHLAHAGAEQHLQHLLQCAAVWGPLEHLNASGTALSADTLAPATSAPAATARTLAAAASGAQQALAWLRVGGGALRRLSLGMGGGADAWEVAEVVGALGGQYGDLQQRQGQGQGRQKQWLGAGVAAHCGWAWGLERLSLTGVLDLGKASPALDWVLPLARLTGLELQGCGLDDQALPALWSLTSLTRLVLDHNPALTGVLPPSADAPEGAAAHHDRDTASLLSGVSLEEASRASSTAAAGGVMLAGEDAMMRVWMPDAAASSQHAVSGSGRQAEGEGDGEGAARAAVGGWGALVGLRQLSLLDTAVSGVVLVQALKEGLAASLTHLRAGAGDGSGVHSAAPSASLDELLYDVDVRDMAELAPCVRVLELQGCGRLTARGVRHLRAWPHLQRLTLRGCPLLAPRDVHAALTSSPTLTHLQLDTRLYSLQASPDGAATWAEVQTNAPSSRSGAPAGQTTPVPMRAKRPSRDGAGVPTASPPLGRSPPPAWGKDAASSVGKAGGVGRWRPAEGDAAVSASFPPSGLGGAGDQLRVGSRAAGNAATMHQQQQQVVDERLRYSVGELLALRPDDGRVVTAQDAEQEWRLAAGELGLLR